MKVTIKCDRCLATVEGIAEEGFTIGFYDLTGYWGRYGNPGERQICDDCMHDDRRYRTDFTITPGEKHSRGIPAATVVTCDAPDAPDELVRLRAENADLRARLDSVRKAVDTPATGESNASATEPRQANPATGNAS